MFDKQYYEDRKKQIIEKSQKNTRNFLANVFNFVEDQTELNQQSTEIDEHIKQGQNKK